ncbi:hypothetical protein D3C78_1132910 [compost metagenome]
MHVHEGLASGLTYGEETVVAHDQALVVAQVVGDPQALVGIHGEAFPVVVADLAVEHRGVLHVVDHVANRSGGQPGRSVGVEHEQGIRDGHVDAAVDHEAGGVHLGRTIQHVAVFVDLDQVRCGDFGVVQTEMVHQEVMIGSRHTRGNVVPDDVVVPVHVRQTVHCRQVHTDIPFFLGKTRLGRRGPFELCHRLFLHLLLLKGPLSRRNEQNLPPWLMVDNHLLTNDPH